MSKLREEPCPQCPFARTTPKSYLDTMGQNGERFAGQSIGPFVLPCHMVKDFGKWKERFAAFDESSPLCAGAAKFRANIGMNGNLPPQLGLAEPDREAVFSTHAELLAHYLGVPLEEAVAFLEAKPVHVMFLEEWNKQTAVRRLSPK